MVANACPTSNIESSDSVGCQFPWFPDAAIAPEKAEAEQAAGSASAAASSAATSAVTSTVAATAVSKAVAAAAFAVADVGNIASWTFVAAS